VWRPDGRPEGATLHRLMSYGADPSTLVFTSGSSFAGGVASEDLGRSGKLPWRDRHSSLHAPGSMTEGVRGLPRGGDPAAYHSSEWAHGTFAPPPGGCSQASAHVARHDGAAGRRKTARRDVVASSDDERSAFGETRRVAPWPVRRGLAAKARASAIPKRASTRKGTRAWRKPGSGRRRRSAWLSWRFTPSKREPGDSQARERISSSVGVPARRISVADFGCSHLLPFECRKALSYG
jgi:hypothetical protein